MLHGNMLYSILRMLRQCPQGFNIDCTSAGSIQESLRVLRQAGEDRVILDILQLQVVRPMKVSNIHIGAAQSLPHREADVCLTFPAISQILEATSDIMLFCTRKRLVFLTSSIHFYVKLHLLETLCRPPTVISTNIELCLCAAASSVLQHWQLHRHDRLATLCSRSPHVHPLHLSHQEVSRHCGAPPACKAAG